MRKYLIILTGILFLFACNNNKKDDELIVTNKNALLAEKVEVMDRIEMTNEDNPDWIKSFNNKAFFETVFGKVFSGEFADCYNNPGNFYDTSRYTVNEIRERMISVKNNNKETTLTDPEPDLSELKEILFNEEWDFNSKKLVFEKKVNEWIPIRVYHRPDDINKENARYKMVNAFRNNNKVIPEKIIAEDYTYIFSFYDEYMERTGLDKKEFLKFMLQKIENGIIKIYDPIYLVDKSKREFTTDQLKNYAGISLDPDEFADEVDKMIFVEDWYFDEKTFNISKKVKGLGFIDDRYKDGWEEKILFFIFFE